MPHPFYSSRKYRNKQSIITKTNWQKGIYHFRLGLIETRRCKNTDCQNIFKVKSYNHKSFCSRSCSAHTHNLGRKLSALTKLKIAKTISLLPKTSWKKRELPKVKLVCQRCHKIFEVTPYLGKQRKYCSNFCAIKTIGSRTTSPKASKGKSGIRKDISPDICFYSTWEANVARVFNLVGIKWKYAPKTFDLDDHTYKPDFYLPSHKMYIEVKNYLGGYSLQRDKIFRQKYPNIRLGLILKADYLNIKANYKDLIKNWEY
jgi:hypothetical protein